MASSKALVNLPFDVHDHIFDAVGRSDVYYTFDFVQLSQKHDLFAASRVCKEWADMTLRARFHTLSLVIKLPGEQSTANYFLQDFVQEPVFTHRQYAKKLTLRWGCGKNSRVDFANVLPRYLPMFPGLLVLELRGVLYKRPEQPIIQRFGLQSLMIDGEWYQWRQHESMIRRLRGTWRKRDDEDDESDESDENGEVWDGAEEYDSLQVDDSDVYDSHDVDPKGLPCIKTFVIRMYEPLPVFVLVLRMSDVRYLDVAGFIDERQRIVNTCSATVEHVKDYVHSPRFEAESDVYPNLNFASIPALRRITLVLVVCSRSDRERTGFLYDEPWTTLAAAVAVLRKRPDNPPPLEYIELELHMWPFPMGYDDQAQTAEARHILAQHSPFIGRADAELRSLVDDGLVESVRVWTVVLMPSYTFQAHSCLNNCLADAFPALHSKGHLRLSEGFCGCINLPGLLASPCASALPKKIQLPRSSQNAA